MEDHGRKIKVAELLGQRFLERKSKIVDEDSHSTDLSVAGEEGHSTILLSHYVFWSKMFRKLTFVVQFAYFSIRPKKGFVFRAILSNFRDKKQLLSDFLRNYRKLFGKSRATCGKS